MEKLRLTVLILSFLLIFTACNKSNDGIELSLEDSLATKNDTTKIQNEAIPVPEAEVVVELGYGSKNIGTITTNLGDADYSLSEDGVDVMQSMEISKSATSADMRAMAKRSSMRASRVSKNLSSSSDNLGFSVGGAKDIGNFRENIKRNYMPVEEDITHEGIFYDYFFDNNITKEATHLFEPAYTSSKTKHPLTNEEELYLSVGLNSNLSASSFKRKKLNLTIVLDISGSMNEGFDRYHYDRNSSDYIDWDERSKIEIAKECMIDLTKHLNEDDRFAVVLFNWESHLAKPFNLLNKTNMSAIRSHIQNINAEGSTNMYEGFSTASELYDNLPNYDSKEYDNRIIFLTDAMPNKGVTDKNSIWGLM